MAGATNSQRSALPTSVADASTEKPSTAIRTQSLFTFAASSAGLMGWGANTPVVGGRLENLERTKSSAASPTRFECSSASFAFSTDVALRMTTVVSPSAVTSSSKACFGARRNSLMTLYCAKLMKSKYKGSVSSPWFGGRPSCCRALL